MLRILRALTQVLQIWWTKDRIRVARSEGKLFRIRVGDRLLIEDKIFRVLARQENQSSAVAMVVYTLEEEQADSDQTWSLSCAMQSENSFLACRKNHEVFSVNKYQYSPLSFSKSQVKLTRLDLLGQTHLRSKTQASRAPDFTNL